MNYTSQTIGQSGPMSASVNQIAGPPDTVQNLMAMVEQLAAELRQRCASVATTIAGPIPEAANSKEQVGANCLIEHLRLITESLSRTLSDIDRAQSRL